jgi:hypothetical protein
VSQPLLRPSFTADIASLDKRVGNLERRTTPRPTTGTASGFGSDSDYQIGSFVWFQQIVTFPSGGAGSNVTWLETDVIGSASNSASPFWSVPSGGGYPITYAPGVYEVTAGLGLASVGFPVGSGGKSLSVDVGGLAAVFTLPSDIIPGAGLVASWRVVVVRPDLGWAPWDFGGGGFHVVHNLGASLTGVYANLIVQKIGHVD